MARVARRGYGDDSIYFDAVKQRWTGAVSLGYTPDGKRRIRRKVTGKTKTEVKDKLKALRREMDAGIHSSSSYTMALCIEDWLSQGLTKLSPGTVANYRYLADHAISKLGAVRLRDLTASGWQHTLQPPRLPFMPGRGRFRNLSGKRYRPRPDAYWLERLVEDEILVCSGTQPH